MSSRTGSTDLEKVLPSLMSEARFLHSKATAASSLNLVSQFGEEIDLGICYKAALLHDIAREWSDEELSSYAREHNLQLEPEEREDPVLLHAPVGSSLLRERGYESSICLAVRYHTLGSISMGRLGLVLFIADYIEEGRTHLTDNEREELRRLPSLDKICLRILIMQGAYLKRKGKEQALCSLDLRRYLQSGRRL